MNRISILIFALFMAIALSAPVSIAAQYDPQVYQAQKLLKAQGYEPGPADGLWGTATQKALMRFQDRHYGSKGR